MNLSLLVLLSLLTVAAAAAHFRFLEEWNNWKAKHGRSYLSAREDLEKHVVWLSNKAYIEAHNINAEVFGYTLEINQFGDLTESEYKTQYGTYRTDEGPKKGTKHSVFHPPKGYDYYPESIDWRTGGAVSDVKNQGSCGSSYAFGTTGALEGAYALGYGTLKNLSEQNLVDCSIPDGNHGCYGGNMYNSFNYIIDNEGIDTETSYPYESQQSQCKFNNKTVGADISGIVSITAGSETDLRLALAYVGPVAVAVDSRANSFRFYSSGIFDSHWCSSYQLNHAMLVIGYSSYNNKDYWMLKNSWGESWGMSGYMMMARNQYNLCGIATDASYPTL